MKGSGTVTLDGVDEPVLPGDSLDVPVGAAHHIAHTGDEDLVLAEVQTGSSLP